MSTTLARETTLADRPTGTSFPGLVGVELRRLWWRRMTKVVVVLVLAFTTVALYSAYTSSATERLAQQLEDYERMRADAERQMREMQPRLPQLVEECRANQAVERQRSGMPDLDLGCETIGTIVPPTLEDLGVVPPVADAITTAITADAVLVYAFLALVLMGSFVAAEFSAGSMGNWLTFKPRRVQVASSKLVAAALGSALIAAVGLGATHLGARMIATVNRPDSSLRIPDPPALADSVPELVLRSAAIVVVAGLLGCALGLLLRHTAGVVGAVLGYGVVVELIAVNTFMQGRLVPWAVIPNANAFLHKEWTYIAQSCSATACQYREHTLTYTHGWIYLLVLAVVAAVVSVLVFRRRDVV